jgi:caa(3)-type oxidase subunit IV
MGNHEHVNYNEQKGGYYKVLVGLLLLTALTFVQPHMFLESYTFGTQLMIGAVKAWLILMYYMHLKGEKLIGWSVIFASTLVAFFFLVVVMDVDSFQFKDVSHITSQPHIDVDYGHHTSHAE